MVYVKGNVIYGINGINARVHAMQHFYTSPYNLKQGSVNAGERRSHDMKTRAKFPKICSLSICLTSLRNPVVDTIQKNSLESFISSLDYWSFLSLMKVLEPPEHTFQGARNYNVKM